MITKAGLAVLDALSTGREATPEKLAAGTGYSPEHLYDVLDELLGAGLLPEPRGPSNQRPIVVLKAARWWYLHGKGGTDPVFQWAIEWTRHLVTDTPSDVERFDEFFEFVHRGELLRMTENIADERKPRLLGHEMDEIPCCRFGSVTQLVIHISAFNGERQSSLLSTKLPEDQ